MIRKLFNIAALLLGEAVESWGTGVTREDLVTLLKEKQERINELEDEVDSLTRERMAHLAQLGNQVRWEWPSDDSGKGCDPFDRPEPTDFPKEIPGWDSTVVYPKIDDTRNTCDTCYRPWVHCVCPWTPT